MGGASQTEGSTIHIRSPDYLTIVIHTYRSNGKNKIYFTAVQSQKAVSEYFTDKQILPVNWLFSSL